MYTTSLGPIIQVHVFSYYCYSDDTQLYLSFQPDDPTVAAQISGCLADISAWMKEHHLQLNLTKTELLVFPATPTLQHGFTIQLGSSTITPSASVRNLGAIFDDQLTFREHIVKTARSCRFALHNIRKIRPFLTQHAAQLVQALVISRLDYCSALLAGLPSNTIKPLQMIVATIGATPRGTITERLKITLQNILFHHSCLVEWSSNSYPEFWIPVNLQATTENVSLSTLLDFILN